MQQKLQRLVMAIGIIFCMATPVKAQEAYLGDVKLVAYNFTPRGWAECDGKLLLISQNNALFSLLGTMYGGDGRTTFALPDLRSRVPVGVGRGPGLEEVQQGQKIYGKKVPDSGSNETMATTTSGLGLRYVICVQGMFPSRN